MNIKEEKDDYTISQYFYQHFGILIRETIMCIYFQKMKRPKLFNYNSFIMSLEGILSKNKKLTPISHDK